MAEAGGSPAGRKATSLTREQLARREALELALVHDIALSRYEPFQKLTLEQRADKLARYITEGVAPG